ncbi:MAG: lipid-A-disaccharide synthase [Desulfobulbaceae bacterium]|jgi:lipid-A-disaccharide synthase|nr:lipid-A-disaccharide synthase [Desulfobulbaceae bacterium]
MQANGQSFEIMLVAGEASGDGHGAALAREMQKVIPEAHLFGMGGQVMAKAGVEILFDAAKISVMGGVEVITRLPVIFSAFRALKNALRARRPALVILIDLPDFNLRLAKLAKNLGIPVLYYITPQVWAWRAGRVKTLGERTDRLAVILPFEEGFFRARGVAAHYVGHPLLDHEPARLSPEEFRTRLGIAEDALCIGLLPGSRQRELKSLLPVFLQAAALLRQRRPEKLVFLLPLASTLKEADLEAAGLRQYRGALDIRVVTADHRALMACCRAAMAASGTVTLELALADTPMVVCYKLAPISYFLGKMLIHVPFFSLVNLIAEKKVVPELLQRQVSAETIAASLSPLVDDGPARHETLSGLELVRARLGSPGASVRVAKMAKAVTGPKWQAGQDERR